MGANQFVPFGLPEAHMIFRRESFQDLFREMSRLQEEVSRRYGQAKSGGFFGFGTAVPPVNVWEDADSVFVEVELPGVDPGKLDVSVTEGDQLTLTGERPAVELPNSVWHRQERLAGSFTRTVALPAQVNA